MKPINAEKLQDLLISYMEKYVLGIAETALDGNISMNNSLRGSLFSTAKIYSEIFEVDVNEVIGVSLKISGQIEEKLRQGSVNIIPKIEIN